MNVTSLFEMGAYTFYVWCAYGATGGGLVLIVWLAHGRLERERIHTRRRRQMID